MNPSDVDAIKALANYGFAAIVAFFLLWRLNGTLSNLKESNAAMVAETRENTHAVRSLSEKIVLLLGKLD